MYSRYRNHSDIFITLNFVGNRFWVVTGKVAIITEGASGWIHYKYFIDD